MNKKKNYYLFILDINLQIYYFTNSKKQYNEFLYYGYKKYVKINISKYKLISIMIKNNKFEDNKIESSKNNKKHIHYQYYEENDIFDQNDEI